MALSCMLPQSNTKHLITTPIWQVPFWSEAQRSANAHQGGNNDVEVPQMHVLWAAELGSKHIHQHLEVLCSFRKVPGQVTEHRVQLPARGEQGVTWFCWKSLCLPTSWDNNPLFALCLRPQSRISESTLPLQPIWIVFLDLSQKRYMNRTLVSFLSKTLKILKVELRHTVRKAC